MCDIKKIYDAILNGNYAEIIFVTLDNYKKTDGRYFNLDPNASNSSLCTHDIEINSFGQIHGGKPPHFFCPPGIKWR